MPLTGDVISGFLAMDSNLKFNPQQNIGHDALLKLIFFWNRRNYYYFVFDRVDLLIILCAIRLLFKM